MKSKERNIQKYALLPFILTFLFFPGVFTMKAQNTVQPDTVNIQDTLATKKSNTILIDHVEVMPQFPGGDKELLRWLLSNIRYPDEAIKNKIEGRVALRFLIKSDGSIDNVAVIRGLDAACDSEAVRVVKIMPNWIPGKQNGKPIDVYYTIPVLFKLPTEIIENLDSTVVLPQFPGGDKALLNFLAKNMRFPDEAVRSNIQGRVILRLVIMEDGSVGNVEIVQNADPALDKEAVRIVKLMPKWIPGTKDGKPVNVYYSLPITFRLSSTTRIGYGI